MVEGTPDELKRRIPGGHVRLRFADAVGLESAARTVGEGSRDDDALALNVPIDGSIGSLKAVLDRLDGEAASVEGLSIHTPTSTTSSSPSPAIPKTERMKHDDTLLLWAGDSATMLRRNLRRKLRHPSMTLLLVGEPIVLLLVFVYVFGGTLGAGLGDLSGGRAAYVDYLVPGILLLTVAFVALGTPVSLAMDMTEGIIARFRTMAISRASVLTGHVLGAMIQTMLSVTVVIGVALLLGFRPTAGPVEWIAAIGFLAMVSWALTWLTVALGLVSGSVESASNIPLPLVFLPFLGSGFVPTDSMPTGLRVFAEYQPFTPVIETVRGLLMGTPIGNSAVLAVGWCAAITLVGFFWARALFNRDPAR